MSALSVKPLLHGEAHLWFPLGDQVIPPFWPRHWTPSITRRQSGSSGRPWPLPLRPDLDNIQSWEGRRTEAASPASLSLSKAGNLATKTTLAIGTASIATATGASRELTRRFGTHGQIKICTAQLAPPSSPPPPLGPSRARGPQAAGWLHSSTGHSCWVLPQDWWLTKAPNAKTGEPPQPPTRSLEQQKDLLDPGLQRERGSRNVGSPFCYGSSWVSEHLGLV